MSRLFGRRPSNPQRIAAYVEMAPDSSYVRVEGLNRTVAVTLAHALTIYLDKHNGLYKPGAYSAPDYTLERFLGEAEERAAAGDRYVFGETRPAERNMAVRVESEMFTLVADTRNELEDRPELEGGKMLRLGFVATMESLGLSEQK